MGRRKSRPEKSPPEGPRPDPGSATGAKTRSPRLSYDQLIRAGLQRHSADLATWLLQEHPLEVKPLDAALVAIEGRTDKILDVRFRDRPGVLLHVELEMKGGHKMPDRMVKYALLALKLLEMPEHRLKRFSSVAIYLDRKAYRPDPGAYHRELSAGVRLSYTYRTVKLWEEDPEPVLRTDVPGVWPFVPLMRGNEEELVRKARLKILRAPDRMVGVEQKRQLLTILGALASRVIADQRILGLLLKELGSMGKNWFLDTLIERREAQLREEALAAGRQEGWREGREEGVRAVILRVLRRRFGSVSVSLRRRLGGVDDLKKLERLAEEAAVAETLRAFEALLPRARK